MVDIMVDIMGDTMVDTITILHPRRSLPVLRVQHALPATPAP